MKIRINEQKIISFTIAYMVSFLGLLNGINAITNEIGFNTSMDTLIMYVSMWGMALFIWVNAFRKKYFKLDLLFVPLIMGIAFVCTLLFFPENTKYIFDSVYTYSNNPLIVFFVYSLTGYVAVRCLKASDYLLNHLRCFSYIIVIMSAITFFVIKDSFANQYMTLSYNMLLQVCFLFIFPPSKGKLLNCIIVVLGMVVIIVGGARGAMIGLVIAILSNFFQKSKKNITFKSIVMISLLIGAGVSAVLFYEQLFYIFVKFIAKNELTSRNLELMLYSNGDLSSGRFELLGKIYEKMNLFGYGLFGDRILLDGSYAHNLFFEWIAEYGIVIGGGLSAALLRILISGLKKGNEISKKLMITFIPNGFVALMFSGSYLGQQPAFYVLLGLGINSMLNYGISRDGLKDEY